MSWLFALLAPALGALLYGADRVMRARMQRRIGPPLLQPFYDMFKLFDKRPQMVHPLHVLMGMLHFAALWASVALILTGGSLLYAIFIHLFAQAALLLGAYSVRSTYSHLGANRELLAVVAYEPVLVLIAVGFYLHARSFDVSAILAAPSALPSFSLLFAALMVLLPLLLKKSPFDAPEAHQEIVGGAEIEYSGMFYEIIYMAKTTQYVFAYALVFLFGGDNAALGLALCGFAFVLVGAVDNATARLRAKEMVQCVYYAAASLALINLAGVLYV